MLYGETQRCVHGWLENGFRVIVFMTLILWSCSWSSRLQHHYCPQLQRHTLRMQADVNTIPGLVSTINEFFHSSVATTLQVSDQSASSFFICASGFNLGKYAISGGFAGGCRAISRAFTFPFDTIKTLDQSDSSLRPKNVDYYRGMWISVCSAIPANAVFFVIYYFLEQLVGCYGTCVSQSAQSTPLSIHSVGASESQVTALFERIVISALATVPQNLMKVPSELIKQRAQIAPEIPVWTLIESAVKRDGWQGLYRGTNAQLLRELPYNAFQMAIFEWLRDLHIQSLQSIDVKFAAALLGLVSSSLAALLTQPADVLKTKLMTDVDEDYNNVYHRRNRSSRGGVLSEAVKEVYQQNGWKGFYAGLGPRLAIVSIGGMIYFAAASIIEGSMP